MDHEDLRTFVLVAERGTFSEAAERLGVLTSTVSRRVARLEQDLGVALLSRSARSFELTDDGRALAARCAPAMQELEEARRDLGDSSDEPRGELRISAAVDLAGSPFLAGMLTGFRRAHPGVEVSLGATNRWVDLSNDGVDVAFRSHAESLPDDDHVLVRRLGAVSFRIYASPSLPGAAGGRVDAAEHPIACHAAVHRDRWPAEPAVTADDFGAVAALLSAGAGIGALPDFLAAPLVGAGRLVEVDVGWSVPDAALSLLWLRSRHLAPRVRVFVDHVTDVARSVGWLQRGS